MAPCRRIVYEYVADVEVAKKRFYVPATSLEALSAIRQRCRDMEALFSNFHVGNVGGDGMERSWVSVGVWGAHTYAYFADASFIARAERIIKEPGPRPSECA